MRILPRFFSSPSWIVLLVLLATAASAATLDHNVFIPMRDGTRLAVDLYLPVQASATVRVPVVLIRTPYDKDGYSQTFERPDSIVRFFVEHGYGVAIQDKRGRFRSEGKYVVSGGDAEDGHDTIDWLSKREWSNGSVGMYGCSYEGDVQLFAAQTKHPALKALIPQASGSSVGSLGGNYRYFGTRSGGVAEWVASIGWFAQNGDKVFPRLDAGLPHEEYNAVSKLWNVERKQVPIDLHQAWTHLPMKEALSSQGMPATDFEDTLSRPAADPYWNTLPYMTESYTSDVPALFINSWYDFGADMTLLEFNHLRARSVSQTARENQFAIMSPHSHCAFEEATADTRVGELQLGDTRFDYRQTYLTWFDAWLKNEKSARDAIRRWPKLRYYAMGRNRWQAAGEWPVASMRERSYFLDSAGRANSLAGDGRLLVTPSTSPAADRFAYDPANPVPSRGGAMCCTGTPDSQPGALDQRPVEARADVLVYTSDSLQQEMEVTGNVKVVLYIASDAVDTDFTAKLVDVYPDGRALNVLEGIKRARYRDGQEKEVWMRPGEIYEMTIQLGATSNVFLPGHRIRLEISSSNFPRFERNLNVGGVNVEQTRWATANNVVHHAPAMQSRLILPVVSVDRPHANAAH